jgi:hypothetical protein
MLCLLSLFLSLLRLVNSCLCCSHAGATASCVLQPTAFSRVPVTGTVEFATLVDGTLGVSVNVLGIVNGSHGIHVHTYGDVSSPYGISVSGHFIGNCNGMCR